MGQMMMEETLGWTMEAPAARAYAVLPVGVATIIPTVMKWSPEKREHASISGFVLQRVKCKMRNGEWTGLWNGMWNGWNTILWSGLQTHC